MINDKMRNKSIKHLFDNFTYDIDEKTNENNYAYPSIIGHLSNKDNMDIYLKERQDLGFFKLNLEDFKMIEGYYISWITSMKFCIYIEAKTEQEKKENEILFHIVSEFSRYGMVILDDSNNNGKSCKVLFYVLDLYFLLEICYRCLDFIKNNNNNDYEIPENKIIKIINKFEDINKNYTRHNVFKYFNL